MKTSQTGLDLIREFEGCKLRAYPDPATGGDPWTIGIGHTGPDVRPGTVITEQRAMELLRQDVARAENCVLLNIHRVMTQRQFDACVSLSYNIGCENFRTSTLCRLMNEGESELAAEQFVRWNRANGKVMDGLTRRRNAERELFLS